MKRTPVVLFAAALAGGLISLAMTGSAAPAKEATPAAHTNAIARGKYLVSRASMCVDCHTPHDQKGGLVEAKQLMGAPIAFNPTVPMPWGSVAPRIAGLPDGFSAEDTVHFLMTGQPPHGQAAARPPMPAYRFNQADAEAITAYLESLAPAKH